MPMFTAHPDLFNETEWKPSPEQTQGLPIRSIYWPSYAFEKGVDGKSSANEWGDEILTWANPGKTVDFMVMHVASDIVVSIDSSGSYKYSGYIPPEANAFDSNLASAETLHLLVEDIVKAEHAPIELKVAVGIMEVEAFYLNYHRKTDKITFTPVRRIRNAA